MEDWKSVLQQAAEGSLARTVTGSGRQRLYGLGPSAEKYKCSERDTFTENGRLHRYPLDSASGKVLLPKMKTKAHYLEEKLLANARRIYVARPKTQCRRRNMVTKAVGQRILDDVLALERRHDQGARKLQRWWKHQTRANVLQKQILANVAEAATRIQRIIRGYQARKVLAKLRRNEDCALHIQTAFRGFLVRQYARVNASKVHEENVIGTPEMCKAHDSLNFTEIRLQRRAAVRIQRLWSRHASQRVAELRALNASAIHIQRYERGICARKKYKQRVRALQATAQTIQRHYRGLKGRSRVFKLLYDRETNLRQEWISLLAADESWYQEKKLESQARMKASRYLERMSALEEELYFLRKQIYDMEVAYNESKLHWHRMSSKTMEMGWAEALQLKIKSQRREITAMKLASVFDVGFRLAQAEEEYSDLQNAAAKAETAQKQLSNWREAQYIQLRERNLILLEMEKALEQRKRIADQKRRWGSPEYYVSQDVRKNCAIPNRSNLPQKKDSKDSQSSIRDLLQQVHDATNLRQRLQLCSLSDRMLTALTAIKDSNV